MNKGWISINRKIQSHWLWEENREFSKLEAWLDVLLTVNHTDKKVMIKNTLFDVKRGDSIKALQTWADRWNWNKSRVRRFFEVLEKDNMIATKNERKTTRLTVCNYDSYQQSGNANETQMKRKRNADETIATPNNNVNNINNANNDEEVKDLSANIKDIEFLKTEYLKNERVINAVCNNPANKMNLDIFADRLTAFNNHLTESGTTVKQSKDYSTHFLRWHKITADIIPQKLSMNGLKVGDEYNGCKIVFFTPDGKPVTDGQPYKK